VVLPLPQLVVLQQEVEYHRLIDPETLGGPRWYPESVVLLLEELFGSGYLNWCRRRVWVVVFCVRSSCLDLAELVEEAGHVGAP
jgi:hypothetical protein